MRTRHIIAMSITAFAIPALLGACGQQPAQTTSAAATGDPATQESCFSLVMYETIPNSGYDSLAASVQARVEQYTATVADLTTKKPSTETTEDLARAQAQLVSATALLKPTTTTVVSESLQTIETVVGGKPQAAAQVAKGANGKYVITDIAYLDPRRTPGVNCSLTLS